MTATKQRRPARHAFTMLRHTDFHGPEADDIWTLLTVADVSVFYDHSRFLLGFVRRDGTYLLVDDQPITLPQWRAYIARLLDLPATPVPII